MVRSLLVVSVLLLWAGVAVCAEPVEARLEATRAAVRAGDRGHLAAALADPALSVRRAAAEGLASLGSSGLGHLFDVAQGPSQRGRLAARRGLRFVSPGAVIATLESVTLSLRTWEDSPARDLVARVHSQLPASARAELGWALAERSGSAESELLRLLGQPALEACARGLDDKDPARVRAALKGIAAFGSQALVHRRAVEARIADPALRSFAMDTLVSIRARDELRALLRAADTREEAVDALTGGGDFGATQLARAALDTDAPPELRILAAGGLEAGCLSAEQLLRALSIEQPEEVTLALVNLATFEGGKVLPHLARHKLPAVRAFVAEWMQLSPRAASIPTELLLEIAKDPKDLVELRAAALFHLRRRGVKGTRELARQLLLHPSSELKVAAIAVLGDLRDAPSLPKIVAALIGGADFMLPHAAKNALANWGPTALPALERLVTSADASERITGLELLAEMDPCPLEARPLLEASLRSAHPGTRFAALEAVVGFARRDGRGPRSQLTSALQDPEGQVRVYAARALTHMGELDAVGEQAAVETKGWVRDTLLEDLSRVRSAQDTFRYLLSEGPPASRLKAAGWLVRLAPSQSLHLAPQILAAAEASSTGAGELIETGILPLAERLSPALRVRTGRLLAKLPLAEFGTFERRARCLAAFTDQSGALEHLRQELRSETPGARIAAASALAEVGSRAAPAAVDLLDRIEDRHELEEVRKQAARALGHLPQALELTLPALLNLVDAPARTLRAHALSALFTLGPAAKAARGALLDLISDPDATLRLEALGALLRVAPDARHAAREALRLHAGEAAPLDEAPLWIELGSAPDRRRALSLLEAASAGPTRSSRYGAFGGRENRSPGLLGERFWVFLMKCGPLALPLATRLLTDPGLALSDRSSGAHQLWMIEGADAALIALAETLLRSEARELREAALNTLVEIAHRSRGDLPRLSQPILDALELAEEPWEPEDPLDPSRARELLRALGPRAAPALPRLIRWLATRRLRTLALDVLGRIGPPARAALPTIAPWAKVGAPQAGLAALALVSIDPTRAQSLLPVLRWALPRAPHHVARAVAGVLGRQEGPGAAEGLSHLRRVLDRDDSIYDHIDAVERLVHHGAQARPLLQALSADPDREPDLRSAAAKALELLER